MELVRTVFRAMGSDCEIVASGESADETRHAIGLAAREVLRIEHKFSRYRNDSNSIVNRINQSAGRADVIACDKETHQLLELCSRIHALSGGLFDITSGVLRRAWDFGGGHVPDPAELSPLLDLIGWEKVAFDVHGIRLPRSGMEIDLGGIGKEYAADRAGLVLKNNSIKIGYVNLGGDIHVVGPQADGTPWRFGVQNPREKSSLVGNIELSSGGLVTSGDYVKFIESNGVRYCHILNPKTGYPPFCWRSVSVTGVSAVMAGACSTVAMLKESEAVPFLDDMGCRYLLVDSEGRCTAAQAKSE